MTQTANILVLPGDGIGPEVMRETRKVLAAVADRRGYALTIEQALVGGAACDDEGVPVSDATMDKAQAADAVLFGAVGGPHYDDLPFDKRPEAGLLRLRSELELFANLRPAMVFPALADASSLKREVVEGLDILIVRELTGGVYFGHPKEIVTLENGEQRAIDTQLYTTHEIQRIFDVACELARVRGGKVCSADKMNVMVSGRLWRQVVNARHAERHTDIELSHMLADALAMQLVRWPKQFDVIVTDNLFGDMLSDEAAMLTGSIGMLPSASLGAPDPETGKRKALYEPVHGSAPDIAGQDKANPIAMILSMAMMLRYSLNDGEGADLVEAAVRRVLDEGYRTGDLIGAGGDGLRQVGCAEMGDAVTAAAKSL